MSQINTNTIANELGTGGPDFVGMPSVGGDPVVESGSNSDGEWTRWADGTQICSIKKDLGTVSDPVGSIYQSGLTTLPYPLSFISFSSATVGGGNYCWGATSNHALSSIRVNAYFYLSGREAIDFCIIIFGRWK